MAKYPLFAQSATRAGRTFNNATGGVNNALSDFGRTLIARLTLADSSASGTARLFGYLADTSDTSNLATNAVVAFQPVSHAAIIKKLGAGGSFRIGSAVYDFAHTDQANEQFSIVRQDITGHKNEVPYFPGSLRTSKDFNSLLVDLVDFQVPVDECTYIDIPLNKSIAAKVVTLTMTLVDLNQPGAAIFGKETRQSNYSESASIKKEQVLAGAMR